MFLEGAFLQKTKQMRLDQKSELESFPEGHILTRIPMHAHGGRAPAGITAKMEFNVRGKKVSILPSSADLGWKNKQRGRKTLHISTTE